jgi:hypothetical protein
VLLVLFLGPVFELKLRTLAPASERAKLKFVSISGQARNDISYLSPNADATYQFT